MWARLVIGVVLVLVGVVWFGQGIGFAPHREIVP